MNNVANFKIPSILDWVKEYQVSWANHVIEAWDSDKMDKLTPFIKSHYWSDRHSINVFSVVGTAHPDYIGLTWLEFLHQGRRMRANQHLLQSNPSYYDETEVKAPSMLYISLNGKHWYVNGDGNHRTCLARFYFDRENLQYARTKTMLHGVTTDDYRIDWDLYHLYINIQKKLDEKKSSARLEVVRTHLTRQDGPGWKIDKYESKLKYIANGREKMLDRETAQALLNQLNKISILSALFKRKILRSEHD